MADIYSKIQIECSLETSPRDHRGVECTGADVPGWQNYIKGAFGIIPSWACCPFVKPFSLDDYWVVLLSSSEITLVFVSGFIHPSPDPDH